jgi:hypothetical protein
MQLVPLRRGFKATASVKGGELEEALMIASEVGGCTS